MDGIKIIHDSHNLKYRKPFGAVAQGQKIKISIEVDKEVIAALEIVKFDGQKKKTGMQKKYLNNGNYLYSAEIDTIDEQGMIGYYFIIMDGFERVYYGNNDENLGGEGQLYSYNPIPYQVTVYNKDEVPKWYKNGIVYQIVIDRFCNGSKNEKILNPKKNSFIYGRWDDTPMYIKDNSGNIARWDFYGGNLLGIIKKLDYIKSLGVSIILLSPIFKAASNHKYDAGDYEKVDEMFGDEEDFQTLCREAEKRDMKIVLEGVFSYTGSDSRYFNKLGNYNEIGAYQSPNSKYYNWYKFSRYPYRYESWWGISERPNIDVMNSSYIDYIIKGKDSVIKKWIKKGAAGWKLNVTDELPDEFIQIINEELKKSGKETVLIGDIWDDASNKISYSKRRQYLNGFEVQSVTNYPLRESLINFGRGYISSYNLKHKILSIYENYPREAFFSNLNIIGTSDTERILTALNGDIQILKILAVIQFTLPGVPLLYYGDEAGIKGGKEPDNRRSYPWGNEDTGLIDFYKKLAGIRNRYESLKKGELKIYHTDDQIFAFERRFENEKTLVIVNTSEKYQSVNQIEINEDFTDAVTGEKGNFNLFPKSFKILNNSQNNL